MDETGVGCAPGRTVEAPCCRCLVSWGRRWSTIWAGSARQQPTSVACSSNFWERGAASRYRAPPSRGSWSARCAGRRSTRRSPALTSSGTPHGAEGRQPQGGRWRARPSQPRHHAIYAKLDLPTLHKVALPRPGGAPMTPPSFDRLVLFLGRFIPARAGNTRGWSASWSQPSVHPCAGGEHSSCKVLIIRGLFLAGETGRCLMRQCFDGSAASQSSGSYCLRFQCTPCCWVSTWYIRFHAHTIDSAQLIDRTPTWARFAERTRRMSSRPHP